MSVIESSAPAVPTGVHCMRMPSWVQAAGTVPVNVYRVIVDVRACVVLTTWAWPVQLPAIRLAADWLLPVPVSSCTVRLPPE